MAVPLLPFLWQEPRRDTPSVAAPPIVLSSPATIAFWERSGWAPRGLIARLRAAPGEIVPFTNPPEVFHIPRPARVSRFDQQVMLFVDGATVSAAEQLVLWARELGRGVVIGQPTGGSIDYQSAWFQRLACRAMGQTLMLPALASSSALPAGGVNATGIVPDRAWKTAGDWLFGLTTAW
jgi:C-terminal processing protease CtpA/Prc